eukprot:TRINITY_DN438_c0_g1_i9.p1 TRINITY_DN438_c0_g1~~TRINITY_DN438_c0_g1_i9.p1  ORF type:complete len:475 (+),score=112.05 TRINITY_DN438_c0_g1_i9:735-2159(+)
MYAVFEILDVKDMCSLLQCSKRLRSVAESCSSAWNSIRITPIVTGAKGLSAPVSVLGRLTPSCWQQIRHLDLSWCGNLGDSSVQRMSSLGLRDSLTAVNLSGCTQLTDAALLELSPDRCPRLREANFSYLPNVKGTTLQLFFAEGTSVLSTLRVCCTHSALLHLLSASASCLESLDVSCYCGYLGNANFKSVDLAVLINAHPSLRYITAAGRNLPSCEAVASRGITVVSRDVMSCVMGAQLLSTVPDAVREGADVNARHNLGRTALHEACRAGRPDAVLVLLQAGADPNLADAFGKVPLSYTLHADIVRQLVPVTRGTSLLHRKLLTGLNLQQQLRGGSLAASDQNMEDVLFLVDLDFRSMQLQALDAKALLVALLKNKAFVKKFIMECEEPYTNNTFERRELLNKTLNNSFVFDSISFQMTSSERYNVLDSLRDAEFMDSDEGMVPARDDEAKRQKMKTKLRRCQVGFDEYDL